VEMLPMQFEPQTYDDELGNSPLQRPQLSTGKLDLKSTHS